MKKLPQIYKSNINKTILNNKTMCHVNLEKINFSVKEVINEIFNGMGYSYNIPVEIKTKAKIYVTSLIAKVNDHIITADNDVILIDDIIEIKKKRGCNEIK